MCEELKDEVHELTSAAVFSLLRWPHLPFGTARELRFPAARLGQSVSE